jgi:ubiquitin carboxyl-terminal hydrolase 12/46
MFREPVHHDAHEFLNYLLNAIADILTEQQRQLNELQSVAISPSNNLLSPLPAATAANGGVDSGGSKESLLVRDHQTPSPSSAAGKRSPHKTWIHELFEGVLVNETRCLVCENVSSTLVFNITLPYYADYQSIRTVSGFVSGNSQ